MEYIKVNLPASPEAEKNGNGEGVFVLVTPEVKAAHDIDEAGTMYEGIIDNDSLYYPTLKHGSTIPFEMRGHFRPVTPFYWLQHHYGDPQE